MRSFKLALPLCLLSSVAFAQVPPPPPPPSNNIVNTQTNNPSDLDYAKATYAMLQTQIKMTMDATAAQIKAQAQVDVLNAQIKQLQDELAKRPPAPPVQPPPGPATPSK